MKLKILWITVIVVILISFLIGVRGQEAVIWKNVSIQQFEFRGKANCVLFVETDKNEKLEVKLTSDQKLELIDILRKKIESLKLELSRQ